MPKDINKALELLKKSHKKDVVVASEYGQATTRICIPSPVFGMNLAMGGGFKIGRLHIITGWRLSWKTGLCIALVTAAQKMDYLSSWLDTEHRFEEALARASGIDTSKLVMPTIEPDGNKVMNYVMTMAKPVTEDPDLKRPVDVIVIDSITKIIDEYMLNRDFEKETQGHSAKKINEYIRKLTAYMAPTNPREPSDITVFAVVTRYHDLGAYTPPHGTPKGKGSGGEQMFYQAGNEVYLLFKYFTCTDIGDDPKKDPYRVKSQGNIGDGSVTGMCIEWQLDKGMLGLAERGRFNVAIRPMPELNLKSGEVDRVLEVVQIAERMKIISSKGAAYEILGEKVTGYANLIKRARKIYTDDPKSWNLLEEEIKTAYNATNALSEL